MNIERIDFARDDRLGLSNFSEVALAEEDTFGLKLALAQYELDADLRPGDALNGLS